MGIETKYYTNANEPKSLGLASAAVGQIPKVKAVDSNGVPTEWEATLLSGDMFYVLDMVYDQTNDKYTIGNDFDEIVEAYNQGKIFVDTEGIILSHSGVSKNSSGDIYSITFDCYDAVPYIVTIQLLRNANEVQVIVNSFMYPISNSEQASGTVYWDKDAGGYIIKNISSISGSSDYVINVTLDTKQSSIGNWVLGYSCTCDKTYTEVLAAYQGGAKVIAHVTRNKEITLSDGSKKTIPIINEAPLTRYIAAQNLLVFDYVHNATDLSVSSGGLTYTTGDSGDSMICYVATYQFAFGAADTSADSVQIPTTTKVQDMINTSISDINTNEYTIQVSNTAPAAGTSEKIITYVVEEATNE